MKLLNYINSSGQFGSSQKNQGVRAVEDNSTAVLLKILAKNSIILPPLLNYLFKSIKNNLNHF